MSSAEITLAADVRSPGLARRFLLATLTAWGHPEYGDDSTLLLTELVTNATLHAKTDITVHIELGPECLRVSVTDGSDRQPALRHYSDQATTGRGLALVTAVARSWGIEPRPSGGKTVWAELAHDDDARTRPTDATTRFTRLSEFREPGPSGATGPEGVTARLQSA